MKFGKVLMFFISMISPSFADGLPFTIQQRPDLDWVSVPVVRSSVENTPTALDVVPNGSPKSYNVLGKAWLHVCSNDVADKSKPLLCGLIGARDDAISFGVSNYNGAAQGHIEWVIGNKVVGVLKNDKITVGAFDSEKVLQEIAALKAENLVLKNQIAQLLKKK